MGYNDLTGFNLQRRRAAKALAEAAAQGSESPVAEQDTQGAPGLAPVSETEAPGRKRGKKAGASV